MGKSRNEAVDLNGVTALAKAFGPSKEHRQQLGRTFIGTLLGQATAFLFMMVVYVTTLVLLNKFAISDLESLQASIGNGWFWVLASVPFVCIVFFSLLPTLWRAARERRLKEKLITGKAHFNPGYFRLHPYGASDSESFVRLDAAGVKILTWIKSSPASLLYLSGVSGVGKSSLLAADILPKLQREDWVIIQNRLFGDPVDQLRTNLLAEPAFFVRRPTIELSLGEILERVSDSRKRKGERPVLVHAV